jgi:glycosyltransferase involved in cell wall biosynthesis
VANLHFIFDVPNLRDFDYRAPNPGIGGTWYACLEIMQRLAARHKVYWHSTNQLALEGVERVPRGERTELFRDEDVVIYPVSALREEMLALRGRHVPWLHNLNDPRLDVLYRRAERIVLVSSQHYDALRWHRAAPKMYVIQNPFDASMYDYRAQHEDYIVYLGALTEGKGFHLYADVMADALQGLQTKLYVVGGSMTYGIRPGGGLGVAQEEYESRFLPPIRRLVEEQRIVFKGNLGLERLALIAGAKLALINPTGRTETYGYSGLECMACGVPVAGGYHFGLIETLYDDEDLKLHSVAQIKPKLTRLLRNPEHLQELRPKVRAFAERMSNIDEVLNRWEQLFTGNVAKQPLLSKHYFVDQKIPKLLIDLAHLNMEFKDIDRLRRLARRSH